MITSLIESKNLRKKTLKLRSSKKLLQLNISIVTIMAAFIMMITFMRPDLQTLPITISIFVGFTLLAISLLVQLKDLIEIK